MKRLLFIDSLRGVAAIYVVIFHAAFLAKPTLELPSWAGLAILNGGTGVTLFFLVSAFSLCQSHHAGFSQPGTKTNFYTRRAFRILPLFYLMLGIMLVRDRWFSPWPHPLAQIMISLVPIYNFFPKDSGGIVPASWTIGTEVVFYAVFPFPFPRLRTFPGVAATILAALLAAAAFQQLLVELDYAPAVVDTAYLNSFAKHLPVFLLGVAIWMVFDRHLSKTELPVSYGWILILGSLWIFHAYTHGSMAVLFHDTYYWQAIVYSGLLLGLAIVPSRLFVNRLWLFCGRISYSIYLSHTLVIFALRPVLAHVQVLPFAVTVRFIICETLVLACVLPVASLAYVLVERPGMRLGHRLGNVVQGRLRVRDSQAR